nr:hypothetical protein [Tanacetum cinerariifolium]
MNLLGHLEISLGSRSIYQERMERRSRNVKNVLNDTRFNQIGKLILRFVVLENIDAIVELFSQGTCFHPRPCFCIRPRVTQSRFSLVIYCKSRRAGCTTACSRN